MKSKAKMKPDLLKPLKILVVENDPVSRTLLQGLLSKSSLPISEAKFAETLKVAFELLNKNDFDVVLLDLNLPDSRGLFALSKISRKHQNVAIVVVTGERSEEFGLKVIAAGAQEYLIKGSYNLENLSKSIRYAIKRKLTQEVLDRKQRNLEAIFDASPVGMMLVDENLVVRRANDTIKQLVKKEYSQIINRKVCSALNCINDTYADEKLSLSPTCKECLIRNTIVRVLDSGQPVHGVEAQFTLELDNGKITPWLSIETMEIKSQFISTVSHELRTPLAAMKEGVAIVLDGVTGRLNKKQKKFLGIAKRNVDRLDALVNDVLDFQKIEAGRVDLDIRDNDIKKVTSEVYETMVLSAKKKRVELLLEFAEDLPEAKFDRSKIVQVLTNLVSNAIKFTPEKGRVSVNVRHENEELVISASDTGIGIPQEALPKIFDRFYCVNHPGKEMQGTGLGLSIVKGIVMMHGGRIEVESQVSQGTTFRVFLPLDSKPSPEVLFEGKDEQLENCLVQNESHVK
ncbi:Sensor histidine kinase RcsC [subsurface metagenome]